jgi:hypothetical protein
MKIKALSRRAHFSIGSVDRPVEGRVAMSVPILRGTQGKCRAIAIGRKFTRRQDTGGFSN